MNRPPRTRSTAAAILLALALTTGACSGDADEKQPSSTGSSASPSAEPAPVGTKATIGKVTGKLPKERQQSLRKAVRDVVDEWFEAAYVGGDYPRNDFHDAFPGFSVGARAQARGDRRLMSNAEAGKRFESVRATRKRVRIDVLAVRRRPVGVTARFVLDFKVASKVAGKGVRKTEVRGRLFLTHTDHGWRVFGYDVTRGDAR